jgi:cytoskeleton protein RodZ
MVIAILVLCLGILAILLIPSKSNMDVEPVSVSSGQNTSVLKVAPAASSNQPTSPAQATSVSQPESVSTVESKSNSETGILVLQARGASWVEVIDAEGALQLRKILDKGEFVRVSGVLPLSVVLGRADLVGVAVRGQSLDVVALAKDNVARFEVK